MPDGPLFDDWFIRVTVSPPFEPGSGATISVAYANPERDRTELFSAGTTFPEDIGEVVGRLVEAYLQSRKSGVVRELRVLQRSKLIS